MIAAEVHAAKEITMRQRKGLGFVMALLAGAAVLMIGTPAAATAEGAAPIAEVRITPGGVDWLPLGEHQGFTLTVAGPQGVVLYREFAPGEVPSLGLVDEHGRALPDGAYSYELRPVAPVAEVQRGASLAEPPRLLSGYLSVRDGSFVVPAARPEALARRSEAGSGESSEIVHVAELVIPENLIVQGDACIGLGCIEADTGHIGLKLKSEGPWILFDDVPACCTADHDWAILINDLFVGGGEYFAVQDRESFAVPFTLSGGAPDHSLFVGPSGSVGFGTSIPGAKLHLFDTATADVAGSAGPNPASGPAFNFGYGGASFGRGAGFLNAKPDASAVAPNPSLRFLTANVERMIVTNAGNVGIGTTAPSTKLHVRGTSGDTAALVEEASATVALRTLLTVRNNGQGRLVVHNTNASAPAGGGYFLSQFDNGRFVIRPSGGGVGLFMDASGNVTAEGNLTVNGTFSNPSSRTLKEDFRPLDPQQVLARFVDVPITEWSYKGDPTRHVGPVSEDFEAAFGLGTTGANIIPLDVQGITMAALQGLYQLVEAKDAEIETLRTENAVLAVRLTALEQRVRARHGER